MIEESSPTQCKRRLSYQSAKTVRSGLNPVLRQNATSLRNRGVCDAKRDELCQASNCGPQEAGSEPLLWVPRAMHVVPTRQSASDQPTHGNYHPKTKALRRTSSVHSCKERCRFWDDCCGY